MADALPMVQYQSVPMPQPNPNPAEPAIQGLQQGGQQAIQAAQFARQQQQALQIAQYQAHQAQVNSALDFMGKIGEQLKYFSPNTQKQAIANGMNTLAKVAPEFGIQPTTPSMVPDDGVDLVQRFGQLRKAHQEGNVSDADFMAESGNLMSQMSEFQRGILKDQESVIGQPTYEAGQTPGGAPTLLNTKTGQQSSPGGQPITGQPFEPTTTVMREQNARQMGAAQAAAPYVSQLSSYHTIKSALSRGDQLGDRTAIMEAGKFLGETPEEMQKLAKSGFFGENMVQYAEKGFGTGDMTTAQRKDFGDIMDMHLQGLQKASGVQMGMYQGATGPNLTGGETQTPAQQPITRALKSGKVAESTDGGKTWFYKQ